MAKKHVIKYWARLIQKGYRQRSDIPADIRVEVINLSRTLPLREDMKKDQ